MQYASIVYNEQKICTKQILHDLQDQKPGFTKVIAFS